MEEVDFVLDKFTDIFNSIDRNGTADTLTKDEKFACCLFAKADMQATLVGSRLNLKTKNECGVVIVDCKIFVAENINGKLRKVYL